MKKGSYGFFKDDLRRTLLFYAIVPVVLLTFVFLSIIWGAWRYSLEKTNENENQGLRDDIALTLESYNQLLDDYVHTDFDMYHAVEGPKRVEVFKKVYEISNKIQRKADLYMFDQGFVPLISATKEIPDFLDGNTYSNWGIYRMMKENPYKMAIKLVDNENTGVKEWVMGRAMLDGDVIIGYVIFVIDSRQFQRDIGILESQTVITDENGGVFITNNYQFLDNMNRFVLNNQQKNGYVDRDENKYFISSTTLLDESVYIYTITLLTNQLRVFWFIFLILVTVFSLMILAVFVSTKSMANKKTKNLYEIINAFEKVKEGNLDTYTNIASNDELSVIGESYNIMLDSLKTYISSNEEMGRLVVSSQMKQLESQFNPHFLFNTLENIRFMSILEPESAKKMIQNLSTLLRYSISNNEDKVTVVEDVLNIENYMSILKYRFGDHFSYSIQIEEGVGNCIIPKLILQPMIENSSKYGFEGREKLRVEVRGRIEENRLILICSDDGAGMDEITLTEIRHIMTLNRNTSEHSGLFNINRRIKLMYGDTFGLQIDSELGRGTTMMMILPVKYNEVVR